MAEIPYTVTYNGLAPWGSGINSGAPYVSVDTEQVFLEGQIGFIRTVSLNGTIPSGGVNQITGLKAAFSSNFKEFIAPNIHMPNAMVMDINFGGQNYYGKVDYSITLKDFSGFLYGVNEPIDEVSFVSEQDGSVTVNHKVSAVGIATNLDAATAFNNAKIFVQGRTGTNNVNALTTAFVDKTNIGDIFVLSQQEIINRATASYGINEVFKYDPLRFTTHETFKRFSIDLNSGVGDDYAQVAVNGTYIVGKDVYDSGLFGRISVSEMYTLANSLYPTLSPLPLSFSLDSEEVTESDYTRTINTKVVFDSNPLSSYFDYEVECNKDFRNGITQVNVRGQILGSGRHVRRRYQSALDFFNNTILGFPNVQNFLFTAATSGATAFGYTDYAFNPIAKSMSVIFNSGQGIININGSFDDAPFVTGYSEFSWDVNCDCGLNVFKPFPSINKNGAYLIQDLNTLNRTNVTLNGNFVYAATGAFTQTEHTTILNLLKNIEGQTNAFSETETYNNTSGEAIKSGFNYVYTKDGAALDGLPANGKITRGSSIINGGIVPPQNNNGGQ